VQTVLAQAYPGVLQLDDRIDRDNIFSNQTLLIQNYADGFNNGNGNKHNNFDDTLNNSLLAATVYHIALLTGNKIFKQNVHV
jgi:hypothetical protein